jgi:hypothetical protein
VQDLSLRQSTHPRLSILKVASLQNMQDIEPIYLRIQGQPKRLRRIKRYDSVYTTYIKKEVPGNNDIGDRMWCVEAILTKKCLMCKYDWRRRK